VTTDEIVVEPEYEQALAVRETAPTLFHTDDPVQVLERATALAVPLADVVRKQQLVTMIQGREHVRVEGWTLLGSMLGVFPVCVWTRELPNGWEARVEARTRDGATVGAAEAMCTTDERTWKSRDAYALRSMAQTRATSKAMRQPLGFVMQLAGFEPTPLEEMADVPSRASESDPYSSGAVSEPPVLTEKQIAQKAAQRLQRMRVKIEKLCQDADKIRAETVEGYEPGTTWGELLKVIEWQDAITGGNKGYGSDWESLNEEGLTWLGQELKAFVDGGCAMGSFYDTVSVPF